MKVKRRCFNYSWNCFFLFLCIIIHVSSDVAIMAKRKKSKQTPKNTTTCISDQKSAEPPELQPRNFPSNKLAIIATEKVGEQLFAAESVLTASECQSWIRYAELGLGMVSTRPKNGKPRKGEAYRDSYRSSISSRQLADRLWESGIGKIIVDSLPPSGRSVAVGFNDNLRFYRYSEGERFGKHYDGSNRDSLGRRTMYTVLFYLSDCVGGATAFYADHDGGETVRVQPMRGKILLHRHGIDCWQHEALPVTNGTKYVMRTDVVYA
mmetsp:Transcript_10661/g.23459  ORF Transcript_10661/g.23459 Transcript_10661/m.23459 type:complete len:265 (-) Transcript_10661:243-1037(-)